jgi:hypothetical protein
VKVQLTTFVVRAANDLTAIATLPWAAVLFAVIFERGIGAETSSAVLAGIARLIEFVVVAKHGAGLDILFVASSHLIALPNFIGEVVERFVLAMAVRNNT